MASIKKSKKRVIVPIAIVLVLAIIITSTVIIVKANSAEQVSLNTIQTGDIYENVNATGQVSAGAKREYKVSTVATVKEVFVQTGDEVKEGDKLATFDTSNLDSQISKLQSTYNSAAKSYNESVQQQQEAQDKLDSVNKQINQLNKDVSKLTKSSKTTTKKSTTKAPSFDVDDIPDIEVPEEPETTTTAVATYTVSASVLSGQENYGTVKVGSNAAGASSTGKYKAGTTVTLKAEPASSYTFAGWYDSDGNKVKSSSEIQVVANSNINYIAQFKTSSASDNIDSLAEALTEIADSIKDVTNDVDTMLSIMEVTSKAISEALAQNQTDAEVIADAVQEAIIEAVNSGIINEDNLNVAGQVLASSIAQAVEDINWKAIATTLTDTASVQLTTKQIQLAVLQAQSEMYSIAASDTAVSAKKELMETAKSALDAVKQSSEELEAGWTASFDGTVTECDLVPGEQTSLVSKGITLENMNTMVVTISLGEYDNHKVKVGMPCKVTTAYGTYDGEVTSKAPTATGGSSTSLLDSVGSMAGISGLSSLTESGAGVECTVEVKKPDENIVIGFDADVEIDTGEYLGVTVVPIESIVLDKTGTYVYLYNEEEGTVTKTLITTGAVSDSAYEVTNGLKPGDKIISAPASSYEEDSFKVKVVDKTKKTDEKV